MNGEVCGEVRSVVRPDARSIERESMQLAWFSLAVAAALAAGADPVAPGWRARFDELWRRRDDPKVMGQLGPLVRDAAAADPAGFDASWRQAALAAWSADGAADGSEVKSQLGKAAWGAGDRAVESKPDDVRGHYYSGVGVGLYSEGVGVLTALREGLEGKFRDRVQAALRIDKDFLDGAPQVLWGRYFYKLPWPKRDVRRSIEVLAACVQDHPNNLRAKVYLADSLDDDGKKDEAKKLVQAAIDAPVRGDQPEEKRVKALARNWMDSH
jgi:hypothetical protein